MNSDGLISRIRSFISDYDEMIVVISFALLLGIINGVIDTKLLGGSLYQNMFQPNLYQVLERLIFIVFALLLGFTWHHLNMGRKESERELRESELRYRTLAKTATDGIISIDENKRIMLMNKAAENIFGYSQEEVLGEDIKVVIPEEYRERHDAGFERYLETGNPTIIGKTVELEGLRKDGTKFPLELSLSVSKLESGCFFTAIVRDISERKRLEQELLDYTEKLEDLNQQKELFSDILRHDLINPVTVIINLSRMLGDEIKEETVKKEVLMIYNNSERLREMIDTAARYAKLKSVDEIEFEDGDLSVFIIEAVKGLSDFAEERGIVVEPKLDGSYLARVNPFIGDVFSNLISNAIKYGPENSRVVIGVVEDGAYWRVFVKDSGEGIADEYKEHIFDRFERVGKGGIKGFGLGLAIVKRVLDLHGGRVWVEDNPEGGCVFNVTVPRAK